MGHVKSAKTLVAEAQRILERADVAARDLTQNERAEVESLLVEAKSAKRVEDLGRELGGGMNNVFTDSHAGDGAGGPGDRFVKSPEYKRIKDPGSRGQNWGTGPIRVSQVALSAKGTLLETGVGGPGGGLVPPYYQPGAVSKLFEPLGVAELFGSSQVTASQIRYVTEGTATSGAAGVAEAGVKPESTIAMSEVVEPIRKLATVLPISSEMLEDSASVQAYLNERLGLFVRLEEERQLLRGTGTNELVGIFGRSGINQYTKLAADDNATALARVLANTAGSSFVQPDAIILHPSNYLSTRLLRDGTGGTAGNFLGGGPFTGAYGNGAASDAGLFGASLWNTRVVLSTHVGVGTALVGNFGQSPHVWRRGGVSVDASESHNDFYVRNLVMLRAEERLGLGCYRASAFTEVRGLA